MLHNELWLVHSNIFNKYWIVETESWVRDLGWFTELQEHTQSVEGWAQFGPFELRAHEYIELISMPDADKKVYCLLNNAWEHIKGPMVFVVRSDDVTHVVGWAGEKKTLDKLKKKTLNAWDWPDKYVVEVDPTIAVVGRPKHKKKFPVFFTSNGETNAEENWKHLQAICPRAIRVDGVQGRRKVFHTCAEMAESSPYFFVVTGKNYITDGSVFDYVPDKTVPKSHIMFHAKNMSNMLEYGHMAVGLYNKNIVLNTPENFGLDFTEYGTIYSVPWTVSEAYFATSPLEAWRTAFRECVKLSLKDDHLSQQWLKRWTSYSTGPFADWVILGAEQGMLYAKKHKYEPEKLQLTVNWEWLSKHFEESTQLVEIHV
jgi:hypothetical protein